MGILNYTTKIAAEKTASEIQMILVRAKAQAVLSEYDAHGRLSRISFRVDTPRGMVAYQLPVNVDGVLQSMTRDKKVPRPLQNRDQATRVAWRIIKDWVEAQMAIIEAGQAELAQVFLPYAQTDSGETIYERVKDASFLRLAAPKGNS